MAGWHHWLDGHEFGWALGVGDGQGGLACCDSWGRKELDTTERLNWTELNWYLRCGLCLFGVIVVQLLSHVQPFRTLCTIAHQASLSCTISEFAQIHVPWVSGTIQPSHPLSPPSPSALNLSQHQGLFWCVLGVWKGAKQSQAKVDTVTVLNGRRKVVGDGKLSFELHRLNCSKREGK